MWISLREIILSLHKHHSNEWKISHAFESNVIDHHQSVQGVREQFPYLCPTVMLERPTWERVQTLVPAHPKLPYSAQSGTHVLEEYDSKGLSDKHRFCLF